MGEVGSRWKSLEADVSVGVIFPSAHLSQCVPHHEITEHVHQVVVAHRPVPAPLSVGRAAEAMAECGHVRRVVEAEELELQFKHLEQMTMLN